MAGGPLLPSSIYLGGASGNLSPTFYISTTATNTASAIEGVGVVASLAATASAVLQYNLPETIPSGTAKILVYAWSSATSGVAKVTVNDGVTAAGSNIGATALTAETQISQTWATADIIVSNIVTLTATPVSKEILTARVDFNATGWTLASTSVWQFALVWE